MGERPEVDDPSSPGERLGQRRNRQEPRTTGEHERTALLRRAVDRRLDGEHQLIAASLDLVDEQRSGVGLQKARRIRAGGTQHIAIVESDRWTGEGASHQVEQRRLAGLARSVDHHDTKSAHRLGQQLLGASLDQCAGHRSKIVGNRGFVSP